jgi:ATP-binding cassette subfamily F protein uup
MDQNCDVIWAFDMINHDIQVFADTIQWEEWHRQQTKESKKESTKNSKSTTSNKKSGLSYKEQKEFESIESIIHKEEELLKRLQDEIQLPEVQNNYEKIGQISAQIQIAEQKLTDLMNRWEDLSLRNNTN